MHVAQMLASNDTLKTLLLRKVRTVVLRAARGHWPREPALLLLIAPPVSPHFPVWRSRLWLHAPVSVAVPQHDADGAGSQLVGEPAAGVPGLSSAKRRLTVISRSSNRINRDGAYQLARLLKTNSTLRVLDLSVNRVQDEGAVAILSVLGRENTTLQ